MNLSREIGRYTQLMPLRLQEDRSDKEVGLGDCYNTQMSTVWIDGEFVDASEAKVSVFDHGLLYGDGCFEGIRVYNGRIFKLRSHLKRMFESAEAIRLLAPYSIDELENAVRETVKINERNDGYIRLVFTRGVGTLGLNPFHCPSPTVFIIAEYSIISIVSVAVQPSVLL